MKRGKVILRIVGTSIGLILLYLITVIFGPGFEVPKQPIPKRRRDDKTPPESREDVSFVVDGLRVSGWLYRPKTTTAAPCIIMSTGLGGTKDGLLERYALRFVEAGYAVLIYDYRHFGESEGEPRQLMVITRQIDDLRAAVAYVRSRPEVDPDNIFLWGTSAGGGYGIVMASEDPRIAGVITQCAALDHDADAKLYLKHTGIRNFLRLFMHAQRDKGRSRFGLSPHRIPIVGQPGTLALELFTEFADFLAVRKILPGIKDRVEGRSESLARQNVEFAVLVNAFLLFGAAMFLLLLRPLTKARWLVGLAAGAVWLITWYSPLPLWASLLLLQLPLLLGLVVVFRRTGARV